MHTIKEVSKLLDMTEHTIRYYTDLGLVPSLERDKNSNRLFNEESVNWLIGVKYLRGSGMSIHAVKNYVDLCLKGEQTLQARYDIILDQKKQLETKLMEMQEQFQYIEQKANWYLDIMNHRVEDTSTPGTWGTAATLSGNEPCAPSPSTDFEVK